MQWLRILPGLQLLPAALLTLAICPTTAWSQDATATPTKKSAEVKSAAPHSAEKSEQTTANTDERTKTEKPADRSDAKQPKKEKLKFVRVAKDENKKPVALQTAVVTYKSDSKDSEGVEVTLIGAVHIAEKSYYLDLNDQFKKYDALLYEMVMDPSQGVPEANQRGSSPVSSVQVGMKDMLELSFQLDEVDYKAKNFVHADMTPEEMFDSMNKRKESVFKMLLRSVGSGLAMQGSGKSNDLDVISAMLSDDRARGMKRAMADQFEMMDGQMAALQGDDGRSTLITERNAKAFEVLREQIKAGKKKIGIFYGAGHFEDMHQRLIDDYRMKPVETKWMDAWDLK